MEDSVEDVSGAGVRGDSEARKRRLLSRVAFWFAGILSAYLSIITVLLPGLSPAKIVGMITIGVVIAAGWGARSQRLYRASAFTVVATTILAGFGASLSNGGLEGYVTPILITAPIIAALFLGARATIAAALAVILAFALLLAAEQGGLVKPTPYSPGATTVAAFTLLAMATILCAAGLAHFARDSDALVRSLMGAQGTLFAMAKRLEFAAYHDPLTGLANRKKLKGHLDALLAGEIDLEDRICVIHVDLDKFKEVNDELGHAVGDGVLRRTAAIMREHFAAGDLIARVGGDEFVIVATLHRSEPIDIAQDLCDTLIERIKQPMSVNGVECQVGASAGYVFADKGCSSAETLIANADIALYDAKRLGRGHALHFTLGMREGLEHRRDVIAGVEQAIHESRVVCLLQPQICLRTGQVLGVEALGRIRTRANDLLTPDVFLDLAEEIGVIDIFDRMVTRRALEALSDLRAAGHRLPHLSINASAKSLRRAHYLDDLLGAIAQHGFQNEDVTVEVLETVVMEDEKDRAAQTIRSMKEAGIRAVLDDFGVGYTSIGVLAKVAFAGIKIDRSLIADPQNARSIQVLKAIRGMARELGLSTVIEGIEEPRQFALAQSLAFDIAQGFDICRPLETEALKVWLAGYGRSPVNSLLDRVGPAGG